MYLLWVRHRILLKSDYVTLVHNSSTVQLGQTYIYFYQLLNSQNIKVNGTNTHEKLPLKIILKLPIFSQFFKTSQVKKTTRVRLSFLIKIPARDETKLWEDSKIPHCFFFHEKFTFLADPKQKSKIYGDLWQIKLPFYPCHQPQILVQTRLLWKKKTHTSTTQHKALADESPSMSY